MRLAGGSIGLGLALLCAAAAFAGGRPHAVITSAPPASTTDKTAAFTFQASGSAPLTGFECSIDRSQWKACRSPASYANLGGGQHLFQVRLVGLGADTSPALHTWTVERREETTTCATSGTCTNPAQPGDPAPATPSSGGTGSPPGSTVRRSPRRDAGGCAYGGNRAGEVRDALIVRATLCLLNSERARIGVSRVRHRRPLARAAARHARDMVRRHYFAHASADGRRVFERVRRAGYLRGARYWSLGEILAWGTGTRSTPEAIVRAWMRSAPHRSVLLRRDFRDVGIDVVRGTPHPDFGAGGTYVAEFGRRG